MSNTENDAMNTENYENITTIITEETGLTMEEPKRRKRVLKKVVEPSMKEAVELAEGKTLVIKEKEEEKPNCGAGQPEPNWKQLYLELKEKTDPLLAKLEEQRQKRNEASKKSKKASREKDKKVKTDLEERVKKLEEKVAEKDFTEVLDEKVAKCEQCDNNDQDGLGPLCAECLAMKEEQSDADAELEHKCADCDNHEDDITDENPLCAECREEKVYHECSNCKGDMCDQYGWCVNCMKRTEKTIQK